MYVLPYYTLQLKTDIDGQWKVHKFKLDRLRTAKYMMVEYTGDTEIEMTLSIHGCPAESKWR